MSKPKRKVCSSSPAPACACGAAEIAKDTILAGFRQPPHPDQTRAFPNTPPGHQAALRWWLSRSRGLPLRICLEPTGTYSLDLALLLSAETRIQLSVPNPRAIRAFGVACMKRDKTDPLDLLLLLEFCQRMELVPWQAPSPEALQLRWVTRRLVKLQKERTAELNRQHAARHTQTAPRVVQESFIHTLTCLNQELAALHQAAQTLVAGHPTLRQRFRLLTSICGFGERAGLLILGELAVLPADMTAREWAAFASLYPRKFDSGSSVHKPSHTGRAGNHYLRNALFMPALVAIRHVPAFTDFRNRLTREGLQPIQAVVAVMRRLLHIIHAVWATNQPFDVHRVGTPAPYPHKKEARAS